MNFNIPEEKEIRTAFADGEDAVVALFGGVTAQVDSGPEEIGEFERRYDEE